MTKFSIIFLVLTFISLDVFAKDLVVQDGFYVGLDAAKNDEIIGKIDNSTAGQSEKDRYYGYKFGDGGFFVAPEVSVEKAPQLTSGSANGNQDIKSDQFTVKVNTNYGLKANVGYDFNRNFSGFLTYDVAKFSYNSGQGGVAITNSFGSANSAIIGVGSQINFSNNFGVKISYSQQQFENSAAGGRVKSDIVKVGTVYSF